MTPENLETAIRAMDQASDKGDRHTINMQSLGSSSLHVHSRVFLDPSQSFLAFPWISACLVLCWGELVKYVNTLES